MSWVENLSNGLKIITGDGRTYEPLCMLDINVSSYDFNISEFNFPEKSGTRIERRLPKGRRFPLEFYFQGSDNIQVSEAFRISANNLNQWTVFHPVFGKIIGHPASIEIDNRGMNTSKITTTFLETIGNNGPETSQDLRASGLKSASQAVEINNESFPLVSLQSSDVAVMSENATDIYQSAVTFANNEETYSGYLNIYGQATNAINNALSTISTGIYFINDFINYPFQFAIGVKQRLSIFKSQIEDLIEKLDNLNDKSQKSIFESQAASMVTGAIQSVLTPQENDYTNAVDVLFVTDQLIEIYNLYFDALQSVQSADATQITSYNPNSELQYLLDYSVNFAVSNLLQIALQAQQERIIYLENDSNVIVQTHRFYGISQDDNQDTIQYFIDTNNIQMRELIGLKKDRKLVYYV
jgi:hypothetical protein